MMTRFKLLIDTNVVIGLEDAQPVQAALAELARLSNEHSVGLFVDGATYDDVARDKDDARRAITISKLAKFQQLRGVPTPGDAELIARFGPINRPNDLSDVRLLVALEAGAIDFIVSQDVGLHKRAERSGLGASVLTIEEALEWTKQTFTPIDVALPYVVERKAYELRLEDPIFESIRADYPGFDEWFDKCKRDHRVCWVLEVDGEIAGLVIRKDETHGEAGTDGPGPKILKLCTFKVAEKYQGEKFGELLLKKALWFAQHNKYDLTYLTAYPKQAFLIDLLSYYGFKCTKTRPNGELVLEKTLVTGRLPPLVGEAFTFDREHYPRFHDGMGTRKFCVPIKPNYHRRLFPEIAFGEELPLFPDESLVLAHGQARTPGNTIRKVYLCRSNSTLLRPGDLIFFYMSKDEKYAFSQSITTVGVVEQVTNVCSTEELVRQTAKRSVFSAEALDEMKASRTSPVKMIDFLLIGHSDVPVPLDVLVNEGIFSGRPPQSIAQLSDEQYAQLRPHLHLGFDIR
jgi:GNAT superfamily N-acetyltransferase